MKEKKYYIFGYGSLMSDSSQIKTISEDHADLGPDILHGFERIFNYQYGSEIYLNLQNNPNSAIFGQVIAVNEEDFNRLKNREAGYELYEISQQLEKKYPGPVYTFIARPNATDGCITKRYVNLCLEGVPKDDHKQWIDKTIINYPFCK